jgi:hypothetical protein
MDQVLVVVEILQGVGDLGNITNNLLIREARACRVAVA